MKEYFSLNLIEEFFKLSKEIQYLIISIQNFQLFCRVTSLSIVYWLLRIRTKRQGYVWNLHFQ